MTATLLTGGAVLPCDGTRTVYEHGAVLFDGSDIIAVGSDHEVGQHPLARAEGTEVVDCSDHAVLPGLVNTHLHSGLLRGTAEAMSLWDWLQTYVDPAHKALTADIAEAASLLCYAESLLAGTTSLLDMWRFPERSAAVADRSTSWVSAASSARGRSSPIACGSTTRRSSCSPRPGHRWRTAPART